LIVAQSAGGEVPPWFWAFPFFFVALWLFVCLVLSFLGGWMSLAKAYRHREESKGRLFRFQSASLRLGTSYRQCLNFGASAAGLYLSPVWLFRAFHSPLFVRWDEIESGPCNMMFFVGVELRFRGVQSIPVRISSDLAWELAQESNGQFRPSEMIALRS